MRSLPCLAACGLAALLAGCHDTSGSPTAPTALAASASAASATISFTDVTAAAGIEDVGISFGASVGDIDGDSWPDIFSSGHYTDHVRLWRNRGDGTFDPWPITSFTPSPTADLHAAQLVDLDEDGDDEIVLLTGACFGGCSLGNHCYSRSGASFVDTAVTLGLDAPLMRARTPLALDYGGDSRLDLFYTAALRPDGTAPPTLFEQLPTSLFATNPVIDLQSGCSFATLGDLDGDGSVDAWFDTDPRQAWSIAGGAAVDITQLVGLPNTSWVSDAVIADFTGDGQNEIYCARRIDRSGFHQVDRHHVEARLVVRNTERGVRIRTPYTANLRVRFQPDWFTPQQVYLGTLGFHPTGESFLATPLLAAGIPPTPPQSPSLVIGHDLTTHEWVLRLHDTGFHEALLLLESDAPIESIEPIGFDPDQPALPDVMLARGPAGFVDIASDLGLDFPSESRSVVAADFDNDMDLDLYVVTADATRNQPNLLLANRGNGKFDPIPLLETSGAKAGIGDAVVTLDYDRDGKVDLFLVNGHGTALRFDGVPSHAFSDDGPAQLFRNTTWNENHWLGIELVGTTSHRSAIGARVEVTCNGITQVREATGGMHRFSQNQAELHFGLGPHATADRIEVFWPSGNVTTWTGTPADQHLTIVE